MQVCPVLQVSRLQMCVCAHVLYCSCTAEGKNDQEDEEDSLALPQHRLNQTDVGTMKTVKRSTLDNGHTEDYFSLRLPFY